MARPGVISAVEARLETWSSKDDCPIIGLNRQGDAPTNGDAFLLVQYPVSDTRRLTMTRKYVEEGAIRFVINAARGEGPDQAITWATELADLFRDQKFAGLEALVPTSPFLDDTNDRGKYFVVTVVVPYRFQFDG